MITLLGYMGSGKSTVGKALANRLGLAYIDLDQHIQTEEKMSISTIFERYGELYFRKKEAQYLSSLLDMQSKSVLALGGGTPCYGNNIQEITEKSVHSIYLKASVGTLLSRLAKEKQQRPLIAHLHSKNEIKEFISKHLFERIPYYSKASITVTVDNKPTDKLVNEIYAQIK